MLTNTAYPLWPISILIILFYSLSFAFSRIGLVSKTNHRKFWNTLLLIAFLVTGIIGLLLVIKINYKLEMSFYEQLVGYHVGFGIGMAVIGFFHFWWHLNYYLHLFRTDKNQKISPLIPVENDLDNRFLKSALFLLGSTSIISQIILLREFLAVFTGNELVVGLVLANWMILTGLGAWLGKFKLVLKRSFPVVFYGLLLLSIIPFTTAFLINFLKNVVFPIGALISVFQIFFASFLLLIPFCLVSGFLFTFISRCYSEEKNQNEVGAAYGFESSGSIAGGLLSGLLFIFVFSSIESLLVMAILNGLFLFLIGLKHPVKRQGWLSLLVLIPAFTLLFFNPEKKIRSWVYPNQKIEISKDTPYGNIVVTRRENLWSVYNNNVLLFDSENFMMNEETVHFPMVQRQKTSRVLLISGGISGQIEELTKYGNISIDYVEDNRWLLALMKDSLQKCLNKRVSLQISDPLRFLRNTANTFDIVILNKPEPSTLQANRFFTLEFFRLLKSKLSPEAVISFGLQAPPNYMNKEAIDLNSSIYSTLKMVFQNVIIIPGEKNYFLASDSSLTYNITQAIQVRGIENRYVNSYYIDDVLLKSRGQKILAALNPDAKINTSLYPVSSGQLLSYWLSQFKEKYRIMAAFTLILFSVIFFGGNLASKAMFVTGFTATGLEILLLFGLQTFFGNIYLLTSFVFTGFMFGLAAGSFYGKSLANGSAKKHLQVTQLLIGGFTAFIGVTLFTPEITTLRPAIIYFLFLTATILTGGLTGIQFTQASKNLSCTYAAISGITYSYDLFGSALGALAVSLYLVPKFGIVESVLTISVLNLVFGFFLFLKKA